MSKVKEWRYYQGMPVGNLNEIQEFATLTTTAPTAAINDGNIHIVYLETEPTTKYDGWIYLIKE